jgi:hypothetical protein
MLMVARLCDVQARFLVKGAIGRGCRAVSRNGRVLLASHIPLPELADRVVELRLQTWHKIILEGEAPRDWGVLLCARPSAEQPTYETRLVREPAPGFDLALELGGGLTLEFRRQSG